MHLENDDQNALHLLLDCAVLRALFRSFPIPIPIRSEFESSSWFHSCANIIIISGWRTDMQLIPIKTIDVFIIIYSNWIGNSCEVFESKTIEKNTAVKTLRIFRRFCQTVCRNKLKIVGSIRECFTFSIWERQARFFVVVTIWMNVVAFPLPLHCIQCEAFSEFELLSSAQTFYWWPSVHPMNQHTCVQLRVHEAVILC